MESILYFFRDTVSGFTYLVYALIILFLIFSVIGYMVTMEYSEKK